ncbi:MAG: putative dsRNA-binding protein, partial [Candidatus Omnitrophota bacterium]|nr:putative dsRNA-binding protein [Candidatus Omnitrophota bacterium]
SLGRISKKIHIGKFLLLGKGEEASGGRNHVSNLLCALEAVIGAIYLDGGLKPASKFINSLFATDIKLVKEGKGSKDHKSTLQQLVLKQYKTIPAYKIISEIGPDHKKHFIVEVLVLKKRYGIGSGPNKKSAEQKAAQEALATIEEKEKNG